MTMSVDRPIPSARLDGPGQPARPGPLRWLRYAFGASLPARYDEWVYLDTTSRTWVLRHLVRAVLQLAPVIAAALLFIPGPFWVRGVGVVGATAMGLLFCFAYMVETTDRRLVKAGYPAGTAEAVRRDRSLTARYAATAQRRAKTAARWARQAERRAARSHTG